MTPQKASPKMPLLILEVPIFLFTKIIGTSTILKPNLKAVYFISIWNPYPFMRTSSRSMASSAALL